ncbi:hypothetical protein [Leifsonia sp. Root112D2]|uniref:hypothetical protein n=1 Tax=Leifsonia sp. Root112D2 TaxID=1736426 RepID=UPI0012F8647D|nr:hypothetical protein [Leifsonia sp. Root112D2]
MDAQLIRNDRMGVIPLRSRIFTIASFMETDGVISIRGLVMNAENSPNAVTIAAMSVTTSAA